MIDTEQKEKWEVYEPRSGKVRLVLIDPDTFWSADVLSNGCVHLYEYDTVPGGGRANPDPETWEKESAVDGINDGTGSTYWHLHPGDIDALIERLQGLKAEAIKHFGPEWMEQ